MVLHHRTLELKYLGTKPNPHNIGMQEETLQPEQEACGEGRRDSSLRLAHGAHVPQVRPIEIALICVPNARGLRPPPQCSQMFCFLRYLSAPYGRSTGRVGVRGERT